MSRLIEELTKQEMQSLAQEILDKKDGNSDKQWVDITEDYDLECSSEVLRKLSAGIKFANDAGMTFNGDNVDTSKSFIERQKLYDMQRKFKQDMRELSRSELICEYIERAIKTLPEIKIEKKPLNERKFSKRDLVVGIGDFHYGAAYNITGLYGETINEYNSEIFVSRMTSLLSEIDEIAKKEKPAQITIMIAGDMLDGMLRISQLQRLEFGAIDGAMKLGESLTAWFVALEELTGIPIRVAAVRGNHGEIRPMGSKAGQFPEENLERMVMHYLYARFMDEEWITFLSNDAPLIQVVDVCGYQFLLTHGQNTDIETLAKDSVNLYHKPIDVFMVAHLHKSQSFISGIAPETNVYVERVPSICGVDPYSIGKGYLAQPGATVILMEEGYGRRCVYPILLK